MLPLTLISSLAGLLPLPADHLHGPVLAPAVARAPEVQADGADSGLDEDPAGDVSPTQAAPGRQRQALPDSIVVTPRRRETPRNEAPFTMHVVDEELIERRAYRTLPQMLRDVPGVLPQETSHGQGSPYIRGFTGYQTLLLLDGVRINNSVFRSGPNQYWATIDGSSLERLEVVKGPTSVLYGSDAVGGTVNALTRSPYIWDRALGGRFSVRFADGEDSAVGRLELGGAFDARTAWLLGLTLKNFSDVEAGGSTGLQPNTGYDEWAGDLKVEHLLSDTSRLTFAHTRVSQDDVPRTHSTRDAISFEGTTIGSDIRRDLDQDRTLTYLRLDTEDEVTTSTTLSYQTQDETQFRTRSDGRMDEQGFDVNTLGLASAVSFDSGPGALTLGFDWYRDSVDSSLQRFALQTPADDIQGPVADNATYDLVGVFAEQQLEVASRTDLTFGVRWTYAAAESDQVRDPVTDDRISIDEDWSELTGSARLTHALDEERTTRAFGGVSQGFRAPNLSDLTRFDSARTNEFEIPAVGLEPEEFVQFEVGVETALDRFSVLAAVHYTSMRDVIQRFPTGNVNGAGENEITKANVGDGEVYGAELGCAWRMDDRWTLFGDVAWLDGEIETVEVAGSAPIEDHITRLQPTTAHLGVRFEPPSSPYFGEMLVTHAADADELSLSDIRDTSRIPPGGTPSYTVLDLRGGYSVSRAFDLTFGVENVTDEDYRIHGSGSNRVGRNFYVGASWSF